ncbi:nucleotide triphosphate diphosphatase NUDT15 [Ferrimonas senticii]|uniref:nucleotide triphosphate diphosphatase NUDT15 n=1 Tax=Ferrimonas senticii TaxID=394566 RepID=UPI0003FBE2F8|nr:NUDIX domain-containing protein [Ferrimonas senticii]
MPSSNQQRPAIGVGIIIERNDGMILLGKRRGGHAPYWSIPGGHLELGESFEEAAARELLEETGLQLGELTVVALTNNLQTYRHEGYHSISVTLHGRYNQQPIVNREPHKCEGWHWFSPAQLPEPHFDASRQSIHCWLQQRLYLPSL